MALPLLYNTPEEYFCAAVEFLAEFSWIYSTPNTKFIKERILEKIPIKWKEQYLRLSNDNINNFPDGTFLVPDGTLKQFQERLEKLKPAIHSTKFLNTQIYLKGVSPKKLHEISRLAANIHDVCSNEIDILVDFGAGLGYLTEVLYKKYKYCILGLECDANRVTAAEERQAKYYPDSIGKVTFKQEFITIESDKFIEENINSNFPFVKNPKIAIIGLHACGDLSIISIKLFFQLNSVKHLVSMPCCYHKLELSEHSKNNNLFVNIPLSKKFKDSLNKNTNYIDFINRPFLRLACQQTVSRWKNTNEEDHKFHGNDMFARGLVECLIGENENVEKLNKSGRIKEVPKYEDIVRLYYLKSVPDKNTLDWTENYRTKFDEIIARYQEGGQMAELLTCLQTALQALCENIVLFDRVSFIKEYAEELQLDITVDVKKLMDDNLSPRCFAFTIKKFV